MRQSKWYSLLVPATTARAIAKPRAGVESDEDHPLPVLATGGAGVGSQRPVGEHGRLPFITPCGMQQLANFRHGKNLALDGIILWQPLRRGTRAGQQETLA